MRLKRLNDEVLYADEKTVKVAREDIDQLINLAARNGRARIRLCAHKDVGDRLHEMLIVHQKGAYVRPHKHLGKTESFHIIQGLVDVVVFSEQGEIVEAIHMGDFGSGLEFYYRIADPAYHTLLIKSDWLVFHETTSGPFERAKTIFAPWAPEENESAAGKQYMDKLAQAVKAQL